ncbi:MAG: hypothetical protein Ct9H300mP14_08160 [Gammaproteobacteria bacterium]|nr:MAG: hypothetical protein Ct9H300mP14_08160 [Gammaproteobacteria bacterium]
MLLSTLRLRHEQLTEEFVLYSRRYMYAGLAWAAEHHSALLIRAELMGGGVFQFPASIDLVRDPGFKSHVRQILVHDR